MDTAKEFQGKSLDEAIEDACAYYGVERGKLEIDIVHDAKTGIFGLVGVRKACIRARKTSATAILEEALAGEKTDKDVVASGKNKTQGKKATRPEGQKPENKKQEEQKPESQKQENQKPVQPKAATGAKSAERGKPKPSITEQVPVKSDGKVDGSSEGRGGDKASAKAAPGEAADEAGQNQHQRHGSDARQEAGPGSRRPQRPVRNAQPKQEKGKSQAEPRPDQRDSRARNDQKKQKPQGVASATDAAGSAFAHTAGTAPATPPDAEGASLFDDEATHLGQLPELDLASLDQALVQQQILDVVSSLITPIVENPTFEVNLQGKQVRVLVHCGEDSGILVGRDGQTLAALQYIATRMVAKRLGCAVRLFIDTGNYRERQDVWLKELALSLAEKAKTSGRSHSTRPLSAYQRRIIHLALDGDEQVHTTSKGEGSLRRVIIMPARGRKGQPSADDAAVSALPAEDPAAPEEYSAEE